MNYDAKLVSNKIDLSALYFKSKEYKKALVLYNELISTLSKLSPVQIKQIRVDSKKDLPIIGPLIHPQLGSLLDQRAAVYEKLGLLEKALKDGELLLKLEPIGCKGYLRQAKILLALNREIDAYKVYQEAIYKIEKVKKDSGISPSPVLLAKLKDQYKKLNLHLKQKKRSTSDAVASTTVPATKRVKVKSANFFLIFPFELVYLIFSHLPLKNLLTCHLVCRQWYNTLTLIPDLYPRFHCKYKVDFNEFKYGTSLMKRIHQSSHTKQIKSLRIVESPGLIHLMKILDQIIAEPNFPVNSIDIYDRFLNFQLILSRLCKNNWKLNNFHSLHTLKLGINTSLINEDMIFRLLKKLKYLQIIVYNSELSGKFSDLVPIKDKIYNRKVEIGVLEDLQTLILVNNPKLIQEELKILPHPTTYNPYPIYLHHNMPNLINLTIVSFDFLNRLPEFGEFLIKSPQLTHLTLEGNCNFGMLDMFQLFKNYNPKFQLTKFGFRNKLVESPVNLNEFTIRDLKQLRTLLILDLNGNSLTAKGCKKLLTIANKSGNLKTLFLGESNGINFPVDKFHRVKQVLRLKDILSIVPKLEQLHLNDLEVDNFTMKQFAQDIRNLGKPCSLKLLELSFCINVTGLGLLQLLDVRDNSPRLLLLEYLVIDGIEISKNTIQLLLKDNYVKNVSNNLNLKRWKQFGKTSWLV